MLGHLIRKEILEHILGLRFLILSGIGAVIVWASLFSGYVFYQGCLKEYRRSQAWTESNYQHRIKSGDARYAANFGYPVQKPPAPMSIFVRGAEATLGQTVYLAGVHILRLKFSPAAEDPVLGVFPPLDLAIVVQVVLSLFVVLMTYDAVCGEKEGGTLRLIFSFPIPRARLLMGKIVGALIPMLAALGLPLLVGIGLVLLLPDVQLKDPELLRLGLILVASGLYLAAFVCAGVLGSSLTHRAATSFVILLFFWVGTVAILPRLSLIVADMVRVAPSTQRLQAELRTLFELSNQRRHKLEDEWIEGYFADRGEHWWRSPEGREGFALMRDRVWKGERMVRDPRADQFRANFRNRYNARLDLAMVLARLSPAFAFNSATLRLAGTGLERHQRFLEIAHQTRDSQSDWYWRHYMQKALGRADPEKYRKYDWDLSDFPRLVYRETWPEEDVQAAMVDIGMLGLWGLVFFVGASVALLRYDLR